MRFKAGSDRGGAQQVRDRTGFVCRHMSVSSSVFVGSTSDNGNSRVWERRKYGNIWEKMTA